MVDLFSCGGGMSAGFAGHDGWRLAAAVDLEVAKPSDRDAGETGCNGTYEANHGLRPLRADLADLAPGHLMALAGLLPGETACLVSCPPCTDLSRANPANHATDKPRNNLVGRTGDFVRAMRPATLVMENARELVAGRHAGHWHRLRDLLGSEGYDVRCEVHRLDRLGLPQSRERAVVTASRVGPARTLSELWEGWGADPAAATVRSALSRLAEWHATGVDDPHRAPCRGMGRDVAARIALTPHDGGGWADLARDPARRHALTADCLRRWQAGKLNSHPDIYGRMWWDRPSPTIKRECAHVGNGRYAHPVEDRLMTVREMATLQGFPFGYGFPTRAVANRYRTIGDAVPPLVARQVAACAGWMLTGRRPDPAEWVMPDTALRLSDLLRVDRPPPEAAVRGGRMPCRASVPSGRLRGNAATPKPAGA